MNDQDKDALSTEISPYTDRPDDAVNWHLAGEQLFRRPPQFLKGVVNVDGLPPPDRPEIAFAGRSNVGKSSLINALFNTKSLARTSNTPGRTREINFFTIEAHLYLVDMPGYGYAKVPNAMVEGWTRLIYDYLSGRVTLKRIFLLIDSRRGIKDKDKDIMGLMDKAAVPYQIVLTKKDKLKTGEADKVLAKTTEQIKRHPAAYPEVLMTSAEKRSGLEDLRAAIASSVNFHVS